MISHQLFSSILFTMGEKLQLDLFKTSGLIKFHLIIGKDNLVVVKLTG